MPEPIAPRPSACPPPTRPQGSEKIRGGGLANTLKGVYARFVKLRGCPREIAKGFALGIFIGMSPSMGIQMLIAVPLAALFKWNKLAAAAGVWISNPITAPLIYGSTYLTGAKILGLAGRPPVLAAPEGATWLKMIAKAPHIFWAMTIGGVVLGLPLAVAAYYLALAAITNYRSTLQRKIAAGREKLAARSSRRKTKKSRRRR
jgi:uncharacterized protein (DUF2062 family)